MAVISHGLILALLPHGWIHHSPTDSSMDFDKSPSDFGEPRDMDPQYPKVTKEREAEFARYRKELEQEI